MTVTTDVGRKRIVATAKLVLERKLTRQCGTVRDLYETVKLEPNGQLEHAVLLENYSHCPRFLIA